MARWSFASLARPENDASPRGSDRCWFARSWPCHSIAASAAARPPRRSPPSPPPALQPHGDMKPIQDRRYDAAGIGENAAKARATIGEGGQRRVLGSADGVKVLADQLRDVCIGSDDGAENLAATGRRFDISDPYLTVPLALLP